MFKHVAFIGLGLIGSSLARVLRANNLADKIVASSRSERTLQTALDIGLIDQGFANAADAVKDADLIVLAMPVCATEKVLALTGLKLQQLDVIELNEAFAAQGLAVLRQLGLQDDDARVNAWGGAIALGHPLGASGARLVTTAVNRLQTTGGRYALCTMCIGVGQGIALILERV